MASKVDVLKDYAGSVLERTLGIRAYKEANNGFEKYSKEDKGKLRLMSGLFGFLQTTYPAAAKGFFHYLGPDINSETYPNRPKDYGRLNGIIIVAYMYPSLGLDIGLGALTAELSGGNIAEFVALKLAANAVTHVGLDVLGAAARRVRTLKPPATTLAI